MSTPPDDHRPLLLIVDDVPTNLQALAAALRDEYRIRAAGDGHKALAIARSEPQPDLILLDVMMPEMDGFSVCRQLKDDPATRHIPVIFVTTLNASADEERGLTLGAVDYITKPLRLPIVRARVRTHVTLKRHADMLEARALLDPLTLQPNRRRFDSALEVEWKRAARDQLALSLLMIDIDDFKSYNDHYGHGAGDLCLRAVSSALATGLLRPSDLLARYGGEEFVALLPNTPAAAAGQIAERLRENVCNLAIPHAHAKAAPHVTVSIGCATRAFIASSDNPHTLLDAADRMLYQAKHAGRNRVVMALTP